jgi:hypothetical protein
MYKITNRPLQLYIDNQNDVSEIISNQQQDSKTRGIYFITGIFIFILSIIYFILNKYLKISTDSSFITIILKSFSNGFLGSCAILVIPIFWVVNFSMGLKYFYI